MGAAFSLLSSGPVLTVLVVSVGFAYLYHTSQIREPFQDSALAYPEEKSKPSSSLKKKSKKKQEVTREVETSAAEDSADVKVPGSEPSTSSAVTSRSVERRPIVMSCLSIVPGGFGGDTTTSAVEQDTDAGSSVKPKKKKKKGKSKKAVTEEAGSSGQVEEKSDAASPPESSTLGRSASGKKRLQLGEAGSAGLDDSEMWTRVESRRKLKSQPSDSKGGPQDAVSDAGITTSVTGNSSPATEDEADPVTQPESSSGPKENRKTLAEKLTPKPRKTGVEE